MPTGYTAKVGEGISFEEFVWTCARAFGALILMRDDPLDAPVPQRFEPSSYYPEALAETRGRVAALEAMTSRERVAEGGRLKAEAVALYERMIAERRAENEKYAAMTARVRDWQPPSPDHENLKAFMLEQLSISTEGTEYYEQALAEAQTKAPGAHFADALSDARRRLKHLEDDERKDRERTEERNRWIEALRQSVPPVADKASA